MRYTTPEWLLENLENRLRLALEQPPVPKTEQSAPPMDRLGKIPSEPSLPASL